MKKYTVYMHTNRVNGKKYIGFTSQSTSLRWRGGEGYRRGYSQETAFYRAIKKYGWENFEHEVCLETNVLEVAKKHEMDLIELHKTYDQDYGYNSTEGGDNRIRFSGTSEELRKSRSVRMKGRVVSPETKEKIRQSRLGIEPWNKGKNMDSGYKEKISKFHGGKKPVILNGEEFQSLTECAKHLGVTRNTVYCWLCGKRKIPAKYGVVELRYK